MTTAARPRRRTALTAVATVGACVYAIVFAWALVNVTFDIWGGLLILPVILILGLGPITRTARREGDAWMVRLLVTALVLKMIGTIIRYAVSFEVYAGSADAQGYHGWGAFIAHDFRQGYFAVDLGGKGEGTQALRLITAYVYMLIGPSKLGGFFAFSFLGFVGLFLLYRAFRIAFPDGDHRRYAVLLFFLPTLLFWPSSIGKESWMLFGIGLSCYGAARFLMGRSFGLPVMAVGMWATSLIRPHITLIVFLAVCAGYLFRRVGRDRPFGPLAKIVGALILVVGGMLVFARVESFFKVQQVDAGSVDTVLANVEQRTSKGSSSFDAPGVDSPLAMPSAFVTVMFRPFIFEAHNSQARAAALETTVLIGLTILAIPRLVRVPRLVWRNPYLALAAALTCMFAFAFANVGNFGILARERVQVLPFLLVLLALPRVERRRPAAAAPLRYGGAPLAYVPSVVTRTVAGQGSAVHS